MSKQSEAKERQMYVPKLTPMVCSNCRHFESVVTQEPSQWGGRTWTKETGMRCGLGGFKVMKMGSCNEHEHDAHEVRDQS
jgi:hypothetical protein